MASEVDLVRDLVGASPTWRTWTSTANEAAGKARTYPFALDRADETPVFPAAFVWAPGGTNRGISGRRNGQLQLEFKAEFSGDEADAAETFIETCSTITQEMLAESLNGGRLMVRSIDLTDPIGRPRKEAAENQYWITYTVQWGWSDVR